MDNLRSLLADKEVRQGNLYEYHSKWRGSRRAADAARVIMSQLGATEDSFLFFCKCVHDLPWDTVTKCATAAKELGRNPPAYFNALIQQEYKKRA